MGKVSLRSVLYDGQRIDFVFERKRVRNLNLRVRRDGSVYVSANERVPTAMADAFVRRKGAFILAAQKRMRESALKAQPERRYADGETLLVLGKETPIRVRKSERDRAELRDGALCLELRDPLDAACRERLVKDYLDRTCRRACGEAMERLWPVFSALGAREPTLRYRWMRSRWGSCIAPRAAITLNKWLGGAPSCCIEFVLAHELCHLLRPDHSPAFYRLLTQVQPDWKERKALLESLAGKL